MRTRGRRIKTFHRFTRRATPICVCLHEENESMRGRVIRANIARRRGVFKPVAKPNIFPADEILLF